MTINTAIQCDRNPCPSFRCYFAFRGNRCRPRAGANESCADSLRILSIMKEPIKDNKTTTNGVYAVQKIVSMVVVTSSRVSGGMDRAFSFLPGVMINRRIRLI